MSRLDLPLSYFLHGIIESNTAGYGKKLEEKLRAFLNLSTGKASLLSDVVSPTDYEILRSNRQSIWKWLQAGAGGQSPLLPPGFPVEYFIGKFGPICVGVDAPKPTPAQLVSESALHACRSVSTRRAGPGEHYLTVSLESFSAYMDLVAQLGLKRSDRYQHSFFGSTQTELYGQVPISFTVTSLQDIATSTNSGMNGKPLVDSESTQYEGLSAVEAVAQRLAWFESELALVEVSIVGAAVHASSQSRLMLRRDAFYSNVRPSQVTWLGEAEYVVPRPESSLLNFRSVNKLPLSAGALSNIACFQFLQNWFSERVTPYSNTEQQDPGPDKEFGRLHFLLAECMRRHEKMANERDSNELSGKVKSAYLRCGGLERDINTPLAALSVYDPVSNPGGIFLCPTYIPSHLVRLCEWFEQNLPELRDTLPDGSFRVHFVHIDSEGEFFQLHTETGGSIIIFTGMNSRTERELLEQIRFRFRIDLSESWRDLEELTKSLCREATLSRPDVVFGGDRAACPLASHSKSHKDSPEVPWMDSDMTGWFWYVKGRPAQDFFCSRSIDRAAEERIVASCPLGFKSIMDCGPARLLSSKDACLCRKLFGADWLRKCTPAHPQIWHGYPQSGAVSSKNLSREKLDWTVLYYSVADLIKAKMLTALQETVDIEIVTPYLDV